MPSIFEDYTNRVTSKGENLRGRYQLDTNTFIESNFDDAPTYRQITVYELGILKGLYGVRVNMIERMGNIRNILLKPGEDLKVGNMAEFEDRKWLIYDRYGHPQSGVKLTAMRTNYTLRWKDADGKKHGVRCYASSSDIGSKSKQNRATIEYNKYDVRLPYGQLYIFIETTEDTHKLDLNHRFIINGVPYEVIGVDNTTHVEDGYGIIQLTIKRITRHPEDDFENEIAYNTYVSSEQSEGNEEKTEEEIQDEVDTEHDERGGGLIW